MDRAVARDRLASAIAAGAEPAHDLLRASLRHRAEQDAMVALRASSLLGGRAEMRVALDTMTGGDGLQRANALEVIESVSERSLVRPLLAMWDGSAAATTSADDAVAAAADDPDPWIRACAELAAARPEGGPMETLTTLSPMERVLFLRKVPLFAELAPPDLLPIASISKEVAFADGDRIAEQGDAGDEMHVIVDGEVTVVAGPSEGGHVLATRSSGDAVGEMALLTSEPRMAGLVARGDVRVLSIDRRRVRGDPARASRDLARGDPRAVSAPHRGRRSSRRRDGQHDGVDVMALQ